MKRSPRIAVIGAGIGGLAAARALQEHGFEYHVYEQVPELGEIGAGLNLSPNALKTFRVLGIEEQAIAAGAEPEEQVIRSWRSGRVIARQQRDSSMVQRFGAGFLCMHRADLLDILGQSIAARQIHLGKRCVEVHSSDTVAVARFSDGTEVEADAIIGADGIHSVVRSCLFGARAPSFTGCICWRGLVPAERVKDIAYGRDMTAWWGPHGHVVHYPVRRGELINFVAHFDSDAWTEESWTYKCDRSELIETYGNWNPALLRLIESSDEYFKWALYDREPLETWGHKRITLLGDSAHPMLPYLGQGACMALEDGCVLAHCLARQTDNVTDALRDYEMRRIPRTTRAQLGSRHRAHQNHLASPAARLWRDIRIALRSHLGKDRSPAQAEWFYHYDVSREP